MKRALLALLTILVLGSCTPDRIVVTHSDGTSKVAIEGTPKYLLFPIEDRAPSSRVEVYAEDSLLQRLYIRLARTCVDYYVPFEVGLHPHMSHLAIRLDSMAMCWDSLQTADYFAPAHDPLRPVWHHTPPYGWMNDPNGMFYLDGEWHLYYQYNPYGNRHGNIHWGHSVSTDLVEWSHYPPVLAPDSLGSCASGSCVVDVHNSAGFGKNAVVAFYTAWGPPQVQCMAYSTDGGYTFTKYEGNPVLTSPSRNFRDPKVFYHDESQRWIMVLAVGHHMEYYSSADLKEWKYESSFGEGYGGHGGVWECPDMLQMAVDGNHDQMKWVLICNINPGGPAGGSATQYFTGDFDGHEFVCDTPPNVTRWMDHGVDNYASVSWNNAPNSRPVIVGWMSNWNYCGSVPTTAFRSANTLPRDLYLYSHDGLAYLGSRPSPEMDMALGSATTYSDCTIEGVGDTLRIESAEQGYRLNLTLQPSAEGVCGVTLLNAEGDKLIFTYDPRTCVLTCDRNAYTHPEFSTNWNAVAKMHYGLWGENMPIGKGAPEEQIGVPSTTDGRLALSLWVDRSSVECFEQSGRWVMTTTLFPASILDRVVIFADQSCNVGGVEVRNIAKSTAGEDR